MHYRFNTSIDQIDVAACSSGPVSAASGKDRPNSLLRATRLASLVAASAALGACALMSSSGPSSRTINRAEGQAVANADIKIIDVTDAVARQVIANDRAPGFAETLGPGQPVGTVIGRGDVLDIAIWEAPPAALFGSASRLSGLPASVSAISEPGASSALPEQMVGSDGRIYVPFAGAIPAAGRSTRDVANEIVRRLTGQAHDPQAVVRIVRNATANATIVGDVGNSTRVPLTARGERLLDVLAAAGGVRQPVDKMTIQITRGSQVVSQPLEAVIRDPRQNIIMQPDDVVTALFQPYSFIALGATGQNAEVPFESVGLTLAQALGRVGGLQDHRANIRGVFLFRLEDPAAVSPELRDGAQLTPDGKIPVIYRIDLRNPGTFFVAQSFPIHNRDVIYVSNAPLADLQKFVNILSSLVYPALNVQSVVR